MKKYSFRYISQCEMCGDSTSHHKILGIRLNQSQGVKPREKSGIGVTIQRCTKCKLVYSNPQPIPNSILDHYGLIPEDYWKPSYFEWSDAYFSSQINTAKNLLDFQLGMKALDIGAGLGKAMLSMESHGFDTYGLEPSTSFYDRAVSTMKIDPERLKLGSVEDLEYKANSFDFITFGAVFEHLYEPSKSLEKVLSWLKPNGVIHIEVPSSEWLISQLINSYYRLLGTNYVTNLSPMHTPFHMYEFSLDSFKCLADRLHFSIESYDYRVSTINYIPNILKPIVRWYMKKFDKGLQLTVYLRKIA